METKMTEQESLEIINKMISTAKEQMQKKHSFYYLLWGYSIVIVTLCVFVMNTVLGLSPYGYFAWYLLFISMAITVLKSISDRKKENVSTYTGSLIGYMWFSLGITYLIFCCSGYALNQYFSPIFTCILAIPVFVTGVAYKFKPLIFGAIVFWVAIGCNVSC